jgi:ribose transport system permease protein
MAEITKQEKDKHRGAPDPGRSKAKEPARARARSSIIRSLDASALIILWLGMFAVLWATEGSTFAQSGTLKTIFGTQEPLVFLAMALVVTFSVGEFDLSVASVLGLSAMLVTDLPVHHGFGLGIAIVLALAAALVVGLFNAVLIVIFGVDGIISTLGMSTLLFGVAESLSGSSAETGLPAGFAQVTNQQLLGLPLSFYYGVIVAIVLAYILTWTPLGRRMVFVGLNRDVSRLAGVRVQRIRFGSYIVSALLCGVGGVLLAASVGGFDPTTSQTYLLPAFAAVFLGTVTIVPGKFNPIGSLVAIYFLTTGIVGLQIAGVSDWISNVFFGGALIVAVSASKVVRGAIMNRAPRRWRGKGPDVPK